MDVVAAGGTAKGYVAVIGIEIFAADPAFTFDGATPFLEELLEVLSVGAEEVFVDAKVAGAVWEAEFDGIAS